MTTATSGSVDAIRDAVREAARTRTGLRIAGSGTWLDAGRPSSATETLSMKELSGITQYVAGDLTLTALAGTSLEEIAAAAGANRQWLALDPRGTDAGSIGATIATASAGPLQTHFGKPRDLVLGVEFVTGAGVVARGGGRVVKNVAGFDLTRLMTGAWGTLGVLTEVTVRLHTRPAAEESFAIPLADETAALAVARVRRALRELSFVPYACEVVNSTLAKHLDLGEQTTAIVRIGGNAESVRAQRTSLATLGEIREIAPEVWPRLRAAEPADASVLRLSRLPSEIEQTWAEATAVCATNAGALIHATPARGVVRCILPASPNTTAREALARCTSTLVGERLPLELWDMMSRPAGASPIATRIKSTFDPHGILNPGLFEAA